MCVNDIYNKIYIINNAEKIFLLRARSFIYLNNEYVGNDTSIGAITANQEFCLAYNI